VRHLVSISVLFRCWFRPRGRRQRGALLLPALWAVLPSAAAEFANFVIGVTSQLANFVIGVTSQQPPMCD
jgi:hypothetical protein